MGFRAKFHLFLFAVCRGSSTAAAAVGRSRTGWAGRSYVESALWAALSFVGRGTVSGRLLRRAAPSYSVLIYFLFLGCLPLLTCAAFALCSSQTSSQRPAAGCLRPFSATTPSGICLHRRSPRFAKERLDFHLLKAEGS